MTKTTVKVKFRASSIPGKEDSENTTHIYLASLDTSMVDKANSIILKSL